MYCPTCKEKVDRAEVAKIACADCGSFFHTACAKITDDDLDFMKSNGSKYRCDSCNISRRKSLHQQPLPIPVAGGAALAPVHPTQAPAKSSTVAPQGRKQTTNICHKQQAQSANNVNKYMSNNNNNIDAIANKNTHKNTNNNNNNTNAGKTDQVQRPQLVQSNTENCTKPKEITIEILYDEIMNLKKVNNDFLSEVKQLKEENSKLSERVCKLEKILNWREQQLLSCAVDIVGVPALTSDNANECTKQVLNTAFGLSVSPEDITKCHVKAPKQPNAKIGNVLRVHFSTAELRRKVMAQKRKVKGKLTSEIFGDTNKTPIYVNESLTNYNRALLTVASKTKKAKNYKHLWVKNGRILIKKDDNGEVVFLKTFDDLSKVT